MSGLRARASLDVRMCMGVCVCVWECVYMWRVFTNEGRRSQTSATLKDDPRPYVYVWLLGREYVCLIAQIEPLLRGSRGSSLELEIRVGVCT